MNGDKELLGALGNVLSAQLSLLHQTFVHQRMLSNWGYPSLSAQKLELVLCQTHHVDQLVARVLFLEGLPPKQPGVSIEYASGPALVPGLDLQLLQTTHHRLGVGVRTASLRSDNASRALLEELLIEDESHIKELESQCFLISSLGKDTYLAEHIAKSP